jgi:hypothetical protein
MTSKQSQETTSEGPTVYEMRIKGHLGSEWTDWFEGLTIQLEENGETSLTGLVADQAALYGLIKKVRDVGLPLLSVQRVGPGQEEVPAVKPSNHSNRVKPTPVYSTAGSRAGVGDETHSEHEKKEDQE